MIQPLNDRVLIKPIVKEVQGFQLTGDAKDEAPERGEVIAVGPGRTLENGEKETIDLKEGDVVVFGKYRTDKFEEGKETYYVVKAQDIYAKIS